LLIIFANEEVGKMKRTILVALILIIFAGLTAPAYAEEKTIFNAIPERYYVPIIAGAVTQVYLQNQVAPMNAFNVTLGLAIAKEAVDHLILGKQTFDWNEAAASVLGASIAFHLSF